MGGSTLAQVRGRYVASKNAQRHPELKERPDVANPEDVVPPRDLLDLNARKRAVKVTPSTRQQLTRQLLRAPLHMLGRSSALRLYAAQDMLGRSSDLAETFNTLRRLSLRLNPAKWVEAEPLATITESQVQKFVWRNLVTRFGLPQSIVTDNGPQFAGRRFQEFCAKHKIQLRFSSVAYPLANGLAEVTNRSIIDGLKKRVSAARSAWIDELPSVLWALRTTPKTPTGESPYSLTFGTEAVLPSEVAVPTPRTAGYDEEASGEGLRSNLDLLEERRADAHRKTLSYKRAIARVYNWRVRPRSIKLEDLVLRKIEVSHPTRVRGKLAPKWEGPYRVIEVSRPGTFRLATMDGDPVPRTWNIQNLRKYFI
ncbi:uncharacterized protein LOC135613501 [Musa acuminata AAA Group]|uniref:uncharacterized protein LOC135613501 n=1 Tax=Musa acuminata AAA Group TaxID=214697 RepID=UPI0031D283F8